MLLFVDMDTWDEYALFDLMAGIFISRELIFKIWSDFISLVLFSIVVSGSDLDALIFLLNLLFILIFSILSSNNVVSLEILF